MSAPTAYEDVIFASATPNINAIVSQLKRNELSARNRLQSIVEDARFVESFADNLNLPLVANERCGSWYIKPERKTGSAYFKSTDGHFGQWSFSLRRLNLQLLSVIRQGKGCIIVDSTRRGKSMPDALSKTVPIWISVLNRLLFPEQSEFHALLTPPTVVSSSEHTQIEARIPGFVRDAQQLSLDIEQLRTTVQRPLRPSWITPATDLDEFDIEDTQNYWPIVLCTASSCDSIKRVSDSSYVQGAADDHESWAKGLTAVSFWQHEQALLATPDEELDAEIARIVQVHEQQRAHRPCTLIQPTAAVFISSNDSALSHSAEFDILVYCSVLPDQDLEASLTRAKKTYIRLVCGEGKIGSRQLRGELNKLAALGKDFSTTTKIMCACSSGRDLGVGVALAILCKHFAEDGQLVATTPAVNKAIIKQKLSWIMVSMPDAAPSRATLQSVNSFLMS